MQGNIKPVIEFPVKTQFILPNGFLQSATVMALSL
jgi:hypothetical protein